MAVKVLVVDDDPQTLQLMSHIVRAQGYEVTTAISGAEALRQVSIASPDVMLLDVMMPEMDGIEVCRRLRANKSYADLPIVLLTAMAEPGDHADGLLAGADDYIAKPVDPASLVARIKSVLRRSRSDQPLGDLLTEIANGAVMTLGAVMAWILIADEERGMLRSAVVAGAVGEMDPQIFLRSVKGSPGDVTFPLSKQISPLCDVVLNDRPLIEQLPQVLLEMPGGELLVRGLDSIAAQVVSILPLSLRGKTLGVMLVARRGDAHVNPPDTRLLTSIAIQAAMAIENVRLVRRLEQREKEIQRDNTFHQMLINTMGDGLVMLDHNSEISFVNQRLCRMTGYDATELIGRPFADLIHQGDKTSADVWLARTSGTTSLEKRLRRKNGTELSVLGVRVPASKNDFGDVIVITDVSDQKVRESELMRRTKQLSALNNAARTMASSLEFDSVPQTILEEAVRVLGANAGSIALLDETSSLVFKAVVGPSSEKLVNVKVPAGHGLIGWVSQNSKSVRVDDVRKDPRFYRGIDQTTGLTTLNVMAVPLLIARRVIGVLELINKVEGKFDDEDLTVVETLAQSAAATIENARLVRDLRVHALELEKAYAELKEADHLKSEMVQNVSHELRAPLTFILGYIELLMSNDFGQISDDQRKALDIVLRKCLSLTKIVNDIVTLQKLEISGLNLQAVSLNTLLTQTLQAAQFSAQEAQQTLVTDMPDRDIQVTADDQRLSQVLDNLVNNAIKFSKPGGTITLRLREEHSFARIEVEDMGIGVPADKLEKIFDRFY
ncbi:MAG: GAF domain-containing protein, partial [Chloroflexota bacterium]